MGYGITHTATLPTVGVTPRSTWAELLVEALDELRTTLDAKVTPAGIDVNANLSFRSGSSYYAATDVSYLGLYLQGSLLSAGTYPGVVYKYAGNLYYNNDSGTQIAITSGSSIAAAAGNITTTGAPAFGSSGVEILWNGTDTAYEMRSGAGANDLADIKVDDVYLNDGSANYVRLHATGVGTDYTIQVPGAPPAATSVVQMSSTGVLTAARADNVVITGTVGTGALSVTGAATVSTTLGVTGASTLTGASTVGSTLGVTGLITATAGLTAAANQHVTISGTGEFRHGSFTKHIPAITGVAITGSPSTGTGKGWDAAAAGNVVIIPIILDTGDRITAVRMRGHDNSASSFVRGEFIDHDISGGTLTQVGADLDTSTVGTGYYSEIVSSLNTTVAAAHVYYWRWTSGAATDTIADIVVTYDR